MAQRHAHDHRGPGHEHDLPARPRVLVFFDYACPFCYVDQHRFEALQREIDFEIVLVPFELRPELDEPVDLAEAGTGPSDRVDEYLERLAEKEGFAFRQPALLPNTHRAIVLGEVARDRGSAIHLAVHHAIFSAYFGEGLDIDDVDVLVAIAAEEGIEREELEAAWREGTYDERIHEFRHLALHLGLDATPAAIICNELLIGSRPSGVLREALQRCGSRLQAAREAGSGDTADDTAAAASPAAKGARAPGDA